MDKWLIHYFVIVLVTSRECFLLRKKNGSVRKPCQFYSIDWTFLSVTWSIHPSKWWRVSIGDTLWHEVFWKTGLLCIRRRYYRIYPKSLDPRSIRRGTGPCEVCVYFLLQWQPAVSTPLIQLGKKAVAKMLLFSSSSWLVRSLLAEIPAFARSFELFRRQFDQWCTILLVVHFDIFNWLMKRMQQIIDLICSVWLQGTTIEWKNTVVLRMSVLHPVGTSFFRFQRFCPNDTSTRKGCDGWKQSKCTHTILIINGIIRRRSRIPIPHF